MPLPMDLPRALERVHAAARVVAEELDTERLASVLAHQLLTLASVDTAWVAWVDGASVLTVAEAGRRAAIGTSDRDHALLALTQRLEVWQASEAHAVVPGTTLTLAALAWRSVLSVPVVNHLGRAVGVLLVANPKLAALIGTAERRLVENLALHAVVGFERAFLLERLDDWTQGLQALLAFSSAVNQHVRPALLVQHLVEHAARFLKATGGWAGLLDAGASPPAFVVTDYWHRGQWHALARVQGPGQGLGGHLLDSEFPYLSNDYPTDALRDAELCDRYGVRRAIAVPIKSSDGAMLGFFEVHRRDEQPPFTWQDAGFLESLANTTAVAIENSQLMEKLAAKNEQVRALSAHNVARLEDERRYIARELHDEAGQALVGVKLGLQVMARLAPSHLPEMREQLDDLREQVNVATTRIKDIAWRLRPPTLDQLGLEVALRQLASEYEHRADLRIALECDPLGARLSHAIETSLYRVVQEALTNVASHAGATRVTIALRATPAQVTLTVSDDGKGFDVEGVEAGLGLLGMRERAGMLHGTLSIDAAPGRGTSIVVTVPIA